jgi:effector-binding domain-containing protein
LTTISYKQEQSDSTSVDNNNSTIILQKSPYIYNESNIITRPGSSTAVLYRQGSENELRISDSFISLRQRNNKELSGSSSPSNTSRQNTLNDDQSFVADLPNYIPTADDSSSM